MCQTLARSTEMFAPETRHTRTPLAALCNLHRACLHTLAKKGPNVSQLVFIFILPLWLSF